MNSNQSFTRLIACIFIPLSIFLYSCNVVKPFTDYKSQKSVIADKAVVSAAHPLATKVGLDIIKQGGNAIDAAIAANAMEGVVEPHMNGIGGDLFAIVWDAKTKKLYGLNGSGRSPKSLQLAEFQK